MPDVTFGAVGAPVNIEMPGGGTVDGVDVSAHATRHASGGADPLTVTTAMLAANAVTQVVVSVRYDHGEWTTPSQQNILPCTIDNVTSGSTLLVLAMTGSLRMQTSGATLSVRVLKAGDSGVPAGQVITTAIAYQYCPITIVRVLENVAAGSHTFNMQIDSLGYTCTVDYWGDQLGFEKAVIIIIEIKR